MAIRSDFDFYLRALVKGRNCTNLFHKFGRSNTLTQEFTPLCLDSIYNMPTPSNATKLRIRAGNAQDSVGGTGAWEVHVLGILQDGSFKRTPLATSGETPSKFTEDKYMRLFRIEVRLSGTYATPMTGSHVGDIVIEDEAGESWGRIDSNTYPRGQSEIGFFSVPGGFDALIFNVQVHSNANKAVDFIMFKREETLKEVAPFSAKRTTLDFVETQGSNTFKSEFPLGLFPQYTDIGFMVKSSMANSVEVDYEIALVKTDA